MLEINKTADGTSLSLELIGRLDTTTGEQFEKELEESMGGLTELRIDLSKLDYISSTGLRVLLSASKTMDRQGSLCITCMSDIVRDTFELTGFIDILNII